MITVTSAEKNRIEGQMKTALPFLNEQIDFKISIEERKKGRSRLTFTQGEVTYQLPIFYVTPSTDDSVWEMLTDHIEEETDSQGIFIIKFHSEQHLIHNAVTYALSNTDLYQKNVLSEMCRLCSYVDLEPYKIQILDANAVKTFFATLSAKPEEKVEKAEISQEISHEEQVTVVKEKEIEQPKKVIEETTKTIKETTKAMDEPAKVIKETTKAMNEPAKAIKETTKVMNEPAKAIKETTKVMDEPAKSMKETKKVVNEQKAAMNASEKVTKVEESKPELDTSNIDLDIRALINDCFGIF